jgi:ATP-dependent phosphofructokinase / diphosphate-dependent phosphofructokinase
MANPQKRIAINVAGGYVPGLNAIVHGAVLASHELGWKILGIRDGYEGLLFPSRFPEGGLIQLTPATMENLAGATGCILGTPLRADPFHVRTVTEENAVEESDASDELLRSVRKQEINAVVSIVDVQSLSIAWKLQRKGLEVVCIPKSAENQVAATQLSFGFNSALSFAVEMLERVRQAAQSARKIGIVEVPGEHAGWLALQGAIAVCADAVLLPEIPYDLQRIADALSRKLKGGRDFGLVVVAEGATPLEKTPGAVSNPARHPLKASLSPGATGEPSHHVMQQSGHAAERVALDLQRLVNHETYPLVLGQLVKGGPATAVDRQLGLAYGAAAVRAIQEDRTGVMVAFQPPKLEFVPLEKSINQIRTVPADSVFVQLARSLGIAFGD